MNDDMKLLGLLSLNRQGYVEGLHLGKRLNPSTACD